ncbi:MAG: twin-arginine translocation signal domain-containing protein, partial [Solimonas sp.]
MLIRILPPNALRESDVTPEAVYLNRRRFLGGLGAGAAALALPPLAAAD